MKNKYHILFEIILLVTIAFLLRSEDIENEDIGSSSKIDSLNRIIDRQILITDSISSLINTRRDTIIQIKTKYEKQMQRRKEGSLQFKTFEMFKYTQTTVKYGK